jgi:S1-C subfamily serine protease
LKNTQKQKITRFSIVLIATALLVSAVAGGLVGYSIVSKQMNDLQNQVSTLQEELANLHLVQNVTYQNITQNVTYQNVTYLVEIYNASLHEVYEEIKDSVVIIRGVIVQTSFWGTYYTQAQGSGFVYNSTGQIVIITNYHVVQDAINITVTFINGNGYVATILGSDPYADLAVLSTNAPQSEYKPLKIIASSTLKVGDPVIAIGTPLGYTGSMTSGIVSALGRTVTVDWSSYPIADCIQTSAPINPGNSGGPLLNYQGEVVGITSYTATYEGVAAQGLGLAIPSSMILREIESLVTKGSYNQHPWLGAAGTDMTYEIAKAMGVNVTYGWLITQVSSGGPADKAGLQGGTKQTLIVGEWVTVGGDIIIAINGTRITSMDDLSTYLEEYTSPGQTISVVLVRADETLTLLVKLEARPPPT